MKVVVGLGNPGQQYQSTRHNAGFLAVDVLADRLGLSFAASPKLFSTVAKNQEWLLIKPQTFMNDSGRAVAAALQFFKLTPVDLTVIHDDLDLALGAFKTQLGTGPKAHNGLLSIYAHLGTEEFTHVRLGIDARADDTTLPPKDYVLQPFPAQELAVLRITIDRAIQALLPSFS